MNSFENGLPVGFFHCSFQHNQWETQIHDHDYIEIAIIATGTGYHKIDGTCYMVKAGEVYIINIENRHCFSPLDGQNTGNLSICFIGFFPEFLYNIGIDPKTLNDIRNMLLYKSFYGKEDHYAVDVILNEEELSKFIALFFNMRKECTSKLSGFIDNTKLIFCSFLIQLSRCYFKSGQMKSSVNNYKISLIKKAIDYCNEKYTEDISLDVLSDYMYISKRHFTRIFHEVTGFSVLDYIQRIRITNACHLLETTNEKVTKIATCVGYTDYRQFNKVFKKLMGMTASEFSRLKNNKIKK